MEPSDDRIKNAIKLNHGWGMDAKALTEATMRYLQGRARPDIVWALANEYLNNGCKFNEKSKD